MSRVEIIDNDLMPEPSVIPGFIVVGILLIGLVIWHGPALLHAVREENQQKYDEW